MKERWFVDPEGPRWAINSVGYPETGRHIAMVNSALPDGERIARQIASLPDQRLLSGDDRLAILVAFTFVSYCLALVAAYLVPGEGAQLHDARIKVMRRLEDWVDTGSCPSEVQ